MMILLVATAVIAFAVAAIAARLARWDLMRERLWMWFTPLWLAPLLFTLVLGVRMWLTGDADFGALAQQDARFQMSAMLSLVWVPCALIGWRVGRLIAR